MSLDKVPRDGYVPFNVNLHVRLSGTSTLIYLFALFGGTTHGVAKAYEVQLEPLISSGLLLGAPGINALLTILSSYVGYNNPVATDFSIPTDERALNQIKDVSPFSDRHTETIIEAINTSYKNNRGCVNGLVDTLIYGGIEGLGFLIGYAAAKTSQVFGN